MRTREQYLQTATTALRTFYKGLGFDLPTIHVSVGFPSRGGVGGRGGSTVIGQCWHGDAQGGTPHIFISPRLETAEEVLAVLVHEHVHAFLPAGSGHKAPFVAAMKAVGLEGKPTATVAGEALTERLAKLDKRLKGWPSEALNVGGAKKQGTRLLKVWCEPCGYIVRMTRTPIETMGFPTCPCGDDMTLAPVRRKRAKKA